MAASQLQIFRMNSVPTAQASSIRWLLLVAGLVLCVSGCSDDERDVYVTATPAATATPSSSATAAAPTVTEPPATATSSPTATATATEPVPTATATETEVVATATPLVGPLLGGETTVFDDTRNAFGQPARNLPLDQRTDFFVGNSFFNRNWVTAPSSNTGLDGLGPVFNARSCSACHFRDGRGRPPVEEGEDALSLLLRLSVPGMDSTGGPLGDAAYGGQLGPQSVLGVPAEGRLSIEYEEMPGQFADGTPYSLRAPTYVVEDLAFGPLDPEIMTSPRVGPFLIGLGLLEAVPEETILALADPEDADGDGISGSPNYVWDVRLGASALGRFGWKANQPTVEQQNAGAFLGDIGLTTSLFPEEDCPDVQSECRAAPNGGAPELDDDKLAFVTFYSTLLAVPARRDFDDPIARRGEVVFDDIGCASCHLPRLETGDHRFSELADQVIHPYTDLLLHDMGPGLADGRPDFLASGNEWRTAPLWGIGLVETVNRHTLFLHDGRARDLTEAILWHGGEAGASAEAFRQLPVADRDALIVFLESL